MRHAGSTGLSVEDLSLAYETSAGRILALRNVSFSVARGETYGLVGESGCGKSTAALAMLGYLAPNARWLGGKVLVQGHDLLRASPAELRTLRGPVVAMVHQDPIGALNPVLTLGAQLVETLRAHRPACAHAMRSEVVAMLGQVALPEPESFMARYPHQASGGQLQRIAIAMALLAQPKLLVLDEPTTGLDVTVEAAVANLVSELARQFDMAVVYISHNLGLIARVCDRIGVMYAGELVEQGDAGAVFARPQHPYSRALMACLPQVMAGPAPARLATIAGRVPQLVAAPTGCVFAPRCLHSVSSLCVEAGPIAMVATSSSSTVRCVRVGALDHLQASLAMRTPAPQVRPPGVSLQALWKTYERGGGLLARLLPSLAASTPALADVSFDVGAGEIVALVGESGSGKSTLARLVAGLEFSTAGSIQYRGVDITNLPARSRPASVAGAVQIVFQNPDRTLNPSHRVRRILARALRRARVPGPGTLEQRIRQQ